MIQKVSQLKEIPSVVDVLCNKCGKSCSSAEEHYFSYASLTVHWGYGSTRDGQVHEAQLCENCWAEIIKGFKHSDLVAEDQY